MRVRNPIQILNLTANEIGSMKLFHVARKTHFAFYFFANMWSSSNFSGKLVHLNFLLEDSVLFVQNYNF